MEKLQVIITQPYKLRLSPGSVFIRISVPCRTDPLPHHAGLGSMTAAMQRLRVFFFFFSYAAET